MSKSGCAVTAGFKTIKWKESASSTRTAVSVVGCNANPELHLRGLPNLFMLLDCGLTPVDGSYVMILHIAVTVPRAKVNTSRLHSGIT